MAKTLSNISIAKLVEDMALYPRFQIDPYHVSEIVEAMESGAALPPPVVDVESLRIVDGWHRVAAWRRLHGPTAKMKVHLVRFKTQEEMLLQAILLNSSHGRGLSARDKTRCLVLGQDLQVERVVLCQALHITTERADTLVATRVAADGTVLKSTLRHLIDADEITADQRSFNTGSAGGRDQLFYIRQVVRLLESGSVDWSRLSVVDALNRLQLTLQSAFAAHVGA